MLKFGGTSIGTTNGLHSATDIVIETATDSRVVVVASALSGVTNRLIELTADWGRADKKRIASHLVWLRDRHRDLSAAVLDPLAENEYVQTVDRQLQWLEATLVNGSNDLATIDGILALGERLSVPIFAKLLARKGLPARAFDSTPLVRTSPNFGNARIDQDTTTTLLKTWHRGIGSEITPVLTGFLGSASDGRTTTLGRSGSDYSASSVAVALGAHVVERWTDTDGIYTANPKEDKTAAHIPSISLKDAIRRHAQTGLGIHPKALDILEEAGIPLHVRSTHSRTRRGSWVVPSADDRNAQPCQCDWLPVIKNPSSNHSSNT